MLMQLTFGFTPKQQRGKSPIIQDKSWLDVSDIARGVGFTAAVQVSCNLHNALQPGPNEVDNDYDQRLYDALWTAHFKLFLDKKQSESFSFTFLRKDWKIGEAAEIRLRVRAVTQEQIVRVGLLQDFQEAI